MIDRHRTAVLALLALVALTTACASSEPEDDLGESTGAQTRASRAACEDRVRVVPVNIYDESMRGVAEQIRCDLKTQSYLVPKTYNPKAELNRQGLRGPVEWRNPTVVIHDDPYAEKSSCAEVVRDIVARRLSQFSGGEVNVALRSRDQHPTPWIEVEVFLPTTRPSSTWRNGVTCID